MSKKSSTTVAITHLANKPSGTSAASSQRIPKQTEVRHAVSDKACTIPIEEFHSFGESKAPDAFDEMSQADIIPKDGFWAWIACLVAVLDQLFLFGTLNIYPLFLVEFQTILGCTTAEGAWLGSMTMGLMKLFGPLASSLTMRFGNRYVMVTGCLICCGSMLGSSFVGKFEQLFGTLSVPYALGTALVITPACVVPMEYFKKYQSVSMGIVAAGSSLGTLILAPGVQILMAMFGWRAVFRLLAVSYFGLFFVNFLVHQRKRNPLSYINKPILKSMIEDLALWRNRVFVLWVLAIAIVYFGYQTPVILLASYALHLGFTKLEASYVLVAMGAATTVSRLLTGTLLKCDLLSRLHVKQIIFVIMGTTYLLLTHVTTPEGLYIFAIVRGLLDGATIVMLPMLTASMVGASKAILGWGYLAGAISVTYTFGPPLAGWVKDLTDSYTIPFIMAGLPLITAGLLLFLLPWAQRTGRRTNVLKRLSNIEPGVLRKETAGTATADIGLDPRKSLSVFTVRESSAIESIHDFIQFTASTVDLASRKSFRKMGKYGGEDSDNESNALPVDSAWQRPVSQYHSDTHIVGILKKGKQESKSDWKDDQVLNLSKEKRTSI